MTKRRGAGAPDPDAVDADAEASPVATSPTPPSAAAWEHVRETPTERAVRGAGLAIAILLFAIAAVIALYNVMRIASIWFEARFVPIVQFVLAGAIMFGCYAVLRRLTRR